MDVSSIHRMIGASLVLAMLAPFGFAQARSSYDPGSRREPAKTTDGFVDFTLKRINPAENDYGRCLEEGRQLLLEETVATGYFWSNVAALGLLGCLFIIILYQRKVEARHEWSAAGMLAQYEQALSRANAQVQELTRKNHEVLESVNALKESVLRAPSRSTVAVDEGTTRAVRPRGATATPTAPAVPKNGATKPQAERSAAVATAAPAGQIRLFKPEVEVVARVNSLEQQLARSEEQQRELRRQLNETGRKLQAEQEKNRGLKGE